MNNDQIRALSMLLEHPGYHAIIEVCTEKKESMAKDFSREIFRGEPLDQRRADFVRGFVRGLDWLMDIVNRSPKLLTKE